MIRQKYDEKFNGYAAQTYKRPIEQLQMVEQAIVDTSKALEGNQKD